MTTAQSSIPESFVRGMCHDIHVATPYRLDLTVSALRRLPSNLVDVYTGDGRYLRALQGVDGPIVISVTQPRADTLSVTADGSARDDRILTVAQRILGTQRRLHSFARHAKQLTWLAPLVRRMRGVRPPSYPTIWEALVNAVTFQQVSLHAATAILRRLVLALGEPTTYDGIPLVVFPSAERYLSAPERTMRTAGLSAGKIATLRRAAEAVVTDRLTERMLEERSSEDAALVLRGIKGVGPWTAAVVLLRGLGRLDVFPGNDSGVAASLALVAGERVDAKSVVEQLGPQRGMLYFYLLLARLEARGDLGTASEVARGETLDIRR